MTGRKKHSAEEIVRKLRQADELAAAGQTICLIAFSARVAPEAVVECANSVSDPVVVSDPAVSLPAIVGHI